MLKTSMMLALLCVASAAIGTAEATEPELSIRDYNAARTYAYRFFVSYLEKYGRGIRIREILNACELKELAAQVDHNLPLVTLYAGEQFGADAKLTPFDLSQKGMVLTVALATQSLIEGYELGYLESAKSDAKVLAGYCASAGNAYNEYLKGKTK